MGSLVVHSPNRQLLIRPPVQQRLVNQFRGSSELDLTQQYFAEMLGVRRTPLRRFDAGLFLNPQWPTYRAPQEPRVPNNPANQHQRKARRYLEEARQTTNLNRRQELLDLCEQELAEAVKHRGPQKETWPTRPERRRKPRKTAG